jgi:hypothetical protein
MACYSDMSLPHAFLQTIVIIMSLSFVGFVTVLHIIGKVTAYLTCTAGWWSLRQNVLQDAPLAHKQMLLLGEATVGMAIG